MFTRRPPPSLLPSGPARPPPRLPSAGAASPVAALGPVTTAGLFQADPRPPRTDHPRTGRGSPSALPGPCLAWGPWPGPPPSSGLRPGLRVEAASRGAAGGAGGGRGDTTQSRPLSPQPPSPPPMVLFSVKAGREPVAGMTAQEALPERREADGSSPRAVLCGRVAEGGLSGPVAGPPLEDQGPGAGGSEG